MIRVYGIDPALSNTGIAGFEQPNERPWLSFVSSEPVGESVEKLADRIQTAAAEIFGKISRRVADGDTVLIVFEGPAPAAASSTGFGKPDERAGLRWVLTLAFRQRGYRIAYVAPTSAKSYWAHNGSAKKAAMLGWARRRYAGSGVGIRDHNQADALALAHMGASWCGILPTPLPPLVNSEALMKIAERFPTELKGTSHGIR